MILATIEVGRSGPGKLRRGTEMESWHYRLEVDGLKFEVDELLITFLRFLAILMLKALFRCPSFHFQ